MRALVAAGVIGGLAGCGNEYDVVSHARVDVFPQLRANAVDLLLVVDNSASMLEEQDHLARSFADLLASLQAGASDWRVGVTTTEPSLEAYRGRLAGGTDEVVLLAATGVEIDRVAYDDAAWPVAADAPLALCAVDAVTNDDPASWTAAVGTPGTWNPCAPAPAGGPDAGPRPPAAGEVVIAELEASSAGCDWVELANPTTDTIDLGGAVLADDGRDRAELPDGTRIGPGGTLVVARDACAGAAHVVAGDGLYLARGVRWIDALTPEAEAVFGDLVSVGTGGYGLEMGLENARLVLADPDTVEANGAFLRPDADLSLMFFSDEDDLSPDAVATYADAFRSLKDPYRDASRVRFGVVAGLDEPPTAGAPSCTSADGEAAYAERYVALADLTGALRRSICGDFAEIASEAGLTLSGLLLAFELSEEPLGDSLVVELYASQDDDSLVGTLARDEDYVVEPRDGSLWLVFDEPPPSGHWIVARYTVAP